MKTINHIVAEELARDQTRVLASLLADIKKLKRLVLKKPHLSPSALMTFLTMMEKMIVEHD